MVGWLVLATQGQPHPRLDSSLVEAWPAEGRQKRFSAEITVDEVATSLKFVVDDATKLAGTVPITATTRRPSRLNLHRQMVSCHLRHPLDLPKPSA